MCTLVLGCSFSGARYANASSSPPTYQARVPMAVRISRLYIYEEHARVREAFNTAVFLCVIPLLLIFL